MAVHHFTAPDVVVAVGWQPMDTFPKDGSTVEVRDKDDHVCKARWGMVNDQGRVITDNIDHPINWRNPE